MTTVYAATDETIIWSDNKRVHKAGRVPLHEPLTVIREYGNWFEIARPANLSLPGAAAYPDYWVHFDDVIMINPGDPQEPPDPGNIPEEEVAFAILTVLRYLKQ